MPPEPAPQRRPCLECIQVSAGGANHKELWHMYGLPPPPSPLPPSFAVSPHGIRIDCLPVYVPVSPYGIRIEVYVLYRVAPLHSHRSCTIQEFRFTPRQPIKCACVGFPVRTLLLYGTCIGSMPCGGGVVNRILTSRLHALHAIPPPHVVIYPHMYPIAQRKPASMAGTTLPTGMLFTVLCVLPHTPSSSRPCMYATIVML